jgi:hypothetical protein
MRSPFFISPILSLRGGVRRGNLRLADVAIPRVIASEV